MTWFAAGAAIVGGVMQSNAASDAAGAQKEASAASIGEQRRQFDLTRGDYAPYRSIGTNALRRLGAYYGVGDSGSQPGSSEADIRTSLTPKFTSGGGLTYDGVGSYESGQGWVNGVKVPTGWSPGTVDQTGLDAAIQDQMRQQGTGQPQTYNDELSQPLQMDPGYQFGLNQGQQAVDRKTAAAGGRISGAALKAANEYATNYATTGYNAAYQRREDRLNRLAALANIGQTSTGASAAAGTNATNAITGIMGSQGDATAAGRLAQGNIWGGAVNQLGALGQRWASTPSNGSSGYYTDPTQIPMQAGGGF